MNYYPGIYAASGTQLTRSRRGSVVNNVGPYRYSNQAFSPTTNNSASAALNTSERLFKDNLFHWAVDFDKPYYLSGEIANGLISFELQTDMYLESISLRLEGEERIGHGYYNQSMHLQATEQLPEPQRWTVLGMQRQQIFRHDLQIFTTNDFNQDALDSSRSLGCFFIAGKRYSYAFSFPIPSNAKAAPSFSTSTAWPHEILSDSEFYPESNAYKKSRSFSLPNTSHFIGANEYGDRYEASVQYWCRLIIMENIGTSRMLISPAQPIRLYSGTAMAAFHGKYPELSLHGENSSEHIQCCNSKESQYSSNGLQPRYLYLMKKKNISLDVGFHWNVPSCPIGKPNKQMPLIMTPGSRVTLTLSINLPFVTEQKQSLRIITKFKKLVTLYCYGQRIDHKRTLWKYKRRISLVATRNGTGERTTCHTSTYRYEIPGDMLLSSVDEEKGLKANGSLIQCSYYVNISLVAPFCFPLKYSVPVIITKEHAPRLERFRKSLADLPPSYALVSS